MGVFLWQLALFSTIYTELQLVCRQINHICDTSKADANFAFRLCSPYIMYLFEIPPRNLQTNYKSLNDIKSSLLEN